VCSLASGCFWLDYPDDCGCDQSTVGLGSRRLSLGGADSPWGPSRAARPRHPRWCGLPARQRRARGGPRGARGAGNAPSLPGSSSDRSGVVAWRWLSGMVGAGPWRRPVVMRRESPRRRRGGPSVIRSGRDDRPWGARRGYCSPATSSVVPGGSIPSFDMIGSPGPQASHLEVWPVGPCRLEGQMARATGERDPQGCG
jgi:hypothetical protein